MDYNFTMGDNATGFSKNRSILHTYTAIGYYNVSVAAYTPYDDRGNTTTVLVMDRVIISNVMVQPALLGDRPSIEVNFTSGTNYTCQWNIPGVLSMETQEGNNSYVFQADTIGRFNVTICCKNFLTEDCKSVIQSVDEKIAGEKKKKKRKKGKRRRRKKRKRRRRKKRGLFLLYLYMYTSFFLNFRAGN